MPAGYSTTPQARKLGLKAHLRVSLDGAPTGWSMEGPPNDLVTVATGERADVVIAFFHRAEELPRRLPNLAQAIFPDGSCWIAWPRRAGGHVSDITDNVIREHALPLGIVDVKVAAIDPDWSGLRFVWRVELRGK